LDSIGSRQDTVADPCEHSVEFLVRRIYRVFGRPLASQRGLCFMEFVIS